MSLTPGTRLGAYTIGPALGAGGMGEVYRATDNNLGREVAIKVLPELFARDADRLARFEREARTLASLNHPNIAIVHGLEKGPAEGPAKAGHYVQALVMELIEGPTLADRIGARPLPLDEVLPIARQIAEALEVAHEQGIVHRDLKPANIKVRDDGTVKVLDFGLAKVFDSTMSGTPASGTNSMSPTITTPAMTQMGVILGTAAYMSPEQARGKTVDRRTDIWAFGCVLYEMLTGRRAFDGDDVTLTLSKVLQSEPEFDALPASVPGYVRQTIRLCLRKPLKERMPDIAAVRLALAGAFDAEPARPAATSQHAVRATRGTRAASLLAIGLAGAAAGGLFVWRLTPPIDAIRPAVTRFAIPAPISIAPAGAGVGRHVLALSPMGTHLVYWADNQLLIRALDRLDDAVVIRGTEEAREPFFSPDGQWIGFHQNGQIKRVSVNGGVPVVVGTARNLWGVTWDPDGMIRYGQGTDGIWQIPAAGGQPTQLVSVEKGALAHGPQLLPGGEWLLYTYRPAGQDSWDRAQIVVQSLRSAERVAIIEHGRDARYLLTGHLLYGLNGTLLAVPFDVRQRSVRGAAVPVVEGVMDADIRTGALHFSVSQGGALTYLTGASSVRRTLMWAGAGGHLDPLTADALPYDAPRVSPDGRRVAVTVNGPDGLAVHIHDLQRKATTQLTQNAMQGRTPLWSRDGSHIVFYSEANGGGLYWQAADGNGPVDRLTTSQAAQVPYSWSADGRTLVFEQRGIDRTSPSEISVLSLDDPTRRVTPLIATPADEKEPAVSPDGKWLAYTSVDENANSDVFVRPFPRVNDGRFQVSTDHRSSAPLWMPDGKRLLFLSRGQVFAASIDPTPPFRAAIPVGLFELPQFYRSGVAFMTSRQWDIAPDGKRFLIVNPGAVTQVGEPARMQIVVATNWFEELKRRVPQ